MARTGYSQEQQKQGNYLDDDVVSPGPCCCFRLGRGNHETKSLLRENSINGGGDYLPGESWAAKQGKKLKELSEVIAGPKWKNFIRKIGRYLKPRKSDRTDYMYTPTSYAMNFDDSRLDEDEIDTFVSFSTRFSSAPAASSL